MCPVKSLTPGDRTGICTNKGAGECEDSVHTAMFLFAFIKERLRVSDSCTVLKLGMEVESQHEVCGKSVYYRHSLRCVRTLFQMSGRLSHLSTSRREALTDHRFISSTKGLHLKEHRPLKSESWDQPGPALTEANSHKVHDQTYKVTRVCSLTGSYCWWVRSLFNIITS